MKITFKESKTVDVTHLLVDAGVRYWEDAKINDVEDESGEIVPFKVGDRWQPTIKLDDGIIINWPKGVGANIHFKICDDGKYHLMNQAGEIVRSIDGYVPAVLCPTRNGYGDYIIVLQLYAVVCRLCALWKLRIGAVSGSLFFRN